MRARHLQAEHLDVAVMLPLLEKRQLAPFVVQEAEGQVREAEGQPSPLCGSASGELGKSVGWIELRSLQPEIR